jgi:hypothetical protein
MMSRLPRPARACSSDRLHGPESGIALIVVILATLVLSALGMSLLVTTATEALIAGHHRDGIEAFYAADAVLERAIPGLATVPDWSALLASPDGVASSIAPGFGDAAMSAVLPDGSMLDLVQATNRLNCPHVFPPPSTPCTAAQMDQVTGDRPWGGNNPRWRLYARGPLAALVPGPPPDTRLYVALWVSDDPSETDGNPANDGADASNPGSGIIQMRGEAFGGGGAHRAVEATAARAGASLRIVSWRQVR